ncbi:TonB-dependent receptor [Pedobacter sp. HMF7647]|uniref:TonB-dependent receptor n=1 Tax=Hufsiella arboris TaxID=2695275 RepID=A0A7K1Y4K4_9SPHI|nr:TonB-dependent receptor [Hufsiella arboris]MXV49503.1 TonB-dependent receptor [Hufsiella arboris]
MRLTVIIACFLLRLTASAQQIGISVVAKDSVSGTPIESLIIQNAEKKVIHQVSPGKIERQAGMQMLIISSPLYNTRTVSIQVKSDTSIIVDLSAKNYILKQVVVNGTSLNKVKDVQIGRERLMQDDINKLPMLLGQKDVLKSFQTLAGVNPTSEGAADLNVRGGTPDQNLVLQDGITLYSSSQLLGLVSTFNPSLIRSADLYKTGFPARYGGRIASVLDVTTLSPETDHFVGNASLGVISSSMMVNVPIEKNKSGLLMSARRSMFDLLKRLADPQGEQFYFYDGYAKFSSSVSETKTISFTGYHNEDGYSFRQIDDHDSQRYNKSSLNKAQSYAMAELKNAASIHTESYQLFYNEYHLKLEDIGHLNLPFYQDYTSRSKIRDLGLKFINQTRLSNSNKFNAGADVIFHDFSPGSTTQNIDGNVIKLHILPSGKARDAAVYAEDEWTIFRKIILRYGLRANWYSTSDTTYQFIEPRIVANYMLNSRTSIKLSYTKAYQPIQALVNNGLGLPVDIILSADKLIKPQSSKQYSASINRSASIFKNNFTFTLEGYYNRQNNLITYRDGYDSRSFTIGSVISTSNWHDGVAAGKGKSFGVELSAEKRSGILQGWVNYTWSKVRHSFAELDAGKPFFPLQDRRNVLNIYQSVVLSDKWQISCTFNYASGQAITVPTYFVNASEVPFPKAGNSNNNGSKYFVYEGGDRGMSRMKPFHKLDIAAQRNLKLLKKYPGKLELGIYNLYNRRNSYFYTVGVKKDPQGNLVPRIQSVSLLPIIPSASLNVSFD